LNLLTAAHGFDDKKFIFNNLSKLSFPEFEKIDTYNAGELINLLKQNALRMYDANTYVLAYHYQAGMIYRRLETLWPKVRGTNDIYMEASFMHHIVNNRIGECASRIVNKEWIKHDIAFADLVDRSDKFLLRVYRDFSWFRVRFRNSAQSAQITADAMTFKCLVLNVEKNNAHH